MSPTYRELKLEKSSHQIFDDCQKRPELVEEVVSEDEVKGFHFGEDFSAGQRVSHRNKLQLDADTRFQDRQAADLKQIKSL